MNINEDRIRKNTEGEDGRAYSQETYPKIFLEKTLDLRRFLATLIVITADI